MQSSQEEGGVWTIHACRQQCRDGAHSTTLWRVLHLLPLKEILVECVEHVCQCRRTISVEWLRIAGRMWREKRGCRQARFFSVAHHLKKFVSTKRGQRTVYMHSVLSPTGLAWSKNAAWLRKLGASLRGKAQRYVLDRCVVHTWRVVWWRGRKHAVVWVVSGERRRRS